jgi:hypothetical protein
VPLTDRFGGWCDVLLASLCRWPGPSLQQRIERQLVLPAAASENG